MFGRVEIGIFVVAVHQIEKFAFCYGFLFVADVQQLGVAFLERFLFGGQLFPVHFPTVDPVSDALNAPIVENGGASVASAETFLVHAGFSELLSAVHHNRAFCQGCADQHGWHGFHRVSRKEVRCYSLFVVAEMQEVWKPAGDALQLVVTDKEAPKAALDSAVKQIKGNIEANHNKKK